MKAIFIESANSYAGPAYSRTSILNELITGLGKGANPLTLDNKYSLVRNTDGFTKLTGYSYEVKKEDDTSGCIINGKTNVKKLIKCLGQINEIDSTGNFYIINANSAHHFSFGLSMRAFQSQIDNGENAAAKKRKKVVVNIDNHVDYGRYQKYNVSMEKQISCGDWGGFHMGYWVDHCLGGAEYLSLCTGPTVLGTGPMNRVYKTRGDGNSEVDVEYFTNEAAILNYLKMYKTGEHDVYFTVDRDFMKDNGTKYGDRNCQYNNADGMKFVKQCIDAIKTNCEILSADITGMPTNGDSAGTRLGFEYGNQFNLAMNDVKNLAKWLS